MKEGKRGRHGPNPTFGTCVRVWRVWSSAEFPRKLLQFSPDLFSSCSWDAVCTQTSLLLCIVSSFLYIFFWLNAGKNVKRNFCAHWRWEAVSPWESQSKIVFPIALFSEKQTSKQVNKQTKKKRAFLGPINPSEESAVWQNASNWKKGFCNGKCQVMLIIITATVWIMRCGESPLWKASSTSACIIIFVYEICIKIGKVMAVRHEAEFHLTKWKMNPAIPRGRMGNT